jgi:hypothetical protein
MPPPGNRARLGIRRLENIYATLDSESTDGRVRQIDQPPVSAFTYPGDCGIDDVRPQSEEAESSWVEFGISPETESPSE